MKDTQIYLASKSPRRRELLRQLGIKFEVIDIDIDESQSHGENPAELAVRLALTKSESGFQKVKGKALPILAADTIVCVDELSLGKPKSRIEAKHMLKMLSGRKHRVLSAVAVTGVEEFQRYSDVRLCETQVQFKTLSEQEIDNYVATEEYVDKAGGYAIQGYAAAFISKIKGSYSGVMGLPLYETADLLSLRNILHLQGESSVTLAYAGQA